MPLMQISGVDDSIPACTSVECKTRDQSQIIYTQVESDPICASSGCPPNRHKEDHPVDYYVPNFGMDAEIIDS